MANGDWRHKLGLVDRLMREVSRQTDPQEMVRAYAAGVRELFHADQTVSVSRRDLDPPWYRITRSRRFTKEVDPWEQKNELPMLMGGVLGEWFYLDRPEFIEHFDVDESDPAYFHLRGMHTVFLLPQYDQGVPMNMTALLWTDASKVDLEQLPNALWQGNLFGRATHSLVLRKELSKAYESLDRELQVVGEMQRSLLPQELPRIPGVTLAAEYRTSQRAGGDLYDLFPMADGTWGMFIADVSGHGTPAAVIMAITHALAHAHPGPPDPPCRLMAFLNQRLSADYTSRTPAFVTAFYGVYDPRTRVLKYTNAGHPPTRLVRAGHVRTLQDARGLPLGIDETEVYGDAEVRLEPGDLLMLFTDGISEAFNMTSKLFGFERLDRTLAEHHDSARGAIEGVLGAVQQWAGGRPAADDQTMLAMHVT